MTLEIASWDPYSDHYALNEEAMLDWEGNMIGSRLRKKYKESNAMIDCINLEDYENLVDETILSGTTLEPQSVDLNNVTSGAQYEIASFSRAITMKRNLDNLHSSIGAMSIIERENNLFEPSRLMMR